MPEHNRNVFSLCSGGQKSEIGIPGRKYWCQQDHAPSGGSKGESVPCLVQWLSTFCGSWLPLTSCHLLCVCLNSKSPNHYFLSTIHNEQKKTNCFLFFLFVLEALRYSFLRRQVLAMAISSFVSPRQPHYESPLRAQIPNLPSKEKKCVFSSPPEDLLICGMLRNEFS